MPEISNQQHFWQLMLKGMDGFLWRWQKLGKLRIHPDQYAAVYLLFANWRRQNDIPVSKQEYAFRLAPLLVRNDEQQQLFNRLWQDYWPETHENIDTGMAAAGRGAFLSPGDSKTENWVGQLRRKLHKRYMRLGLSLMLAGSIMVAAWVGYERFILDQPPIGTGALIDAPPTLPNKPDKLPDTAEANLKPDVLSIPLRQPPPPLTLNQDEKTRLEAGRLHLLLIALCLILSVNALLWWLRRVVFQSQPGLSPEQDQFHLKLSAQNPNSELLPGMNSLLARLKFAHKGLTKIHWDKTIRETVRLAGFPVLRYRNQYRQIDFVLLADCRHRHDHSAWLLKKLAETLRKEQIRVHAYEFDHFPEWFWPEGQRNRKPLSLEQTLASHHDSRVLLVAEHDILFYRLTGEVQAWLKSLRQGCDLQLALLTSPNTEQSRRLREEGCRFRLFRDVKDLTPLLDYASSLNSADQAENSSFDNDWFANIPPENTQTVIDWIIQNSGEGGLRLLAVMAMYPSLDGERTFALYQCFADSRAPKPLLQPADLLKASTLPWSRQGWLPQWLRQALLKQMPEADYAHARGFYLKLFEKDPPLTGRELILELQKPSRSWRALLEYLNRHASGQSSLGDSILARVLLLPYNPFRQLSLLRRSLNALPTAALSQFSALFLLLSFSTVSLFALNGLWDAQIKDWYGQQMLKQKRHDNAGILVTLAYAGKAQALLEPAAKGLQAQGFQVAYRLDDTLSGNWIIAGPEQINTLAEVLDYIGYSTPFSLVTEQGGNRIELAGLPQTGQVFRDNIPQTPRLQTAYPEQINGQAGDGGKQTEDVVTLTPILPKMIPVPTGEFRMGSTDEDSPRYDNETPQHPVRVAAFELAETELSFAEWDVCVRDGACKEVSDENWGREKRPVINVSWHDAQKYIEWLNQKQRLSGKQVYRLPSEAEWEYAARAGGQSEYAWGDASQCEYANGADQTLKANKKNSEFYSYADCTDVYAKTAPVDTFKPNSFKLYNMSGNVWEWVEDCWHENYNNAPNNGTAWSEAGQGDCSQRSVRGGSWDSRPEGLRSAIRGRFSADVAFDALGFRLARTI